ncbi:Bifunctional ligase/repressor BirA [bioreactor metagenome]|uniref:Bifunctional ligase/repressor BirA n=1 Tax=bioreactor metagenome TaxID=1076179 RepID=A0A645CED0_9ZZZZ
MTVQDHLRTLLESNKSVFLSGEEIARRLGVSRNAVWKAIKALQADGYPIQAVPNRGYCLAASSDVLSESGIRQYLTPEAQSLDLRVFDAVDSTNLVLRKLANEGAPEGTVVIAAEQTGGRGRKGRSFFSPQGTGVYVSLLLKPKIAPDDATLITTTAAVAVCGAVEALSGEPASIKWVNDVFMRGKKICGILTEGSFDMESGQFEYAILGSGINVFAPDEGFPPEIREIAGSVLTSPAPDAKNRMIAEYLNRFLPLYRKLGDTATNAEYRRRSFVLGRMVNVLAADRSTPARAIDVDDHCRLIVEFADGHRESLSSGEISVKVI